VWQGPYWAVSTQNHIIIIIIIIIIVIIIVIIITSGVGKLETMYS
jgi:hypothetical protein